MSPSKVNALIRSGVTDLIVNDALTVEGSNILKAIVPYKSEFVNPKARTVGFYSNRSLVVFRPFCWGFISAPFFAL